MEDTITAEALSSAINESKNGKASELLILDVRRKGDFNADPTMIPGATWRDPDNIEVWSKDIPEKSSVVIYCVRGGSVSRSVAGYLNSKGIETSYIEGGITAWKDTGNEVS